ncbi:MAG: hypothetical protein CEN90_498 [Parcubacteria group bacterium Licking1014_17]|nr:MAG: hypothetical protein CEN90_498 [Parcubacteria group bacterium Licking1014_17]
MSTNNSTTDTAVNSPQKTARDPGGSNRDIEKKFEVERKGVEEQKKPIREKVSSIDKERNSIIEKIKEDKNLTPEEKNTLRQQAQDLWLQRENYQQQLKPLEAEQAQLWREQFKETGFALSPEESRFQGSAEGGNKPRKTDYTESFKKQYGPDEPEDEYGIKKEKKPVSPARGEQEQAEPDIAPEEELPSDIRRQYELYEQRNLEKQNTLESIFEDTPRSLKEDEKVAKALGKITPPNKTKYGFLFTLAILDDGSDWFLDATIILCWIPPIINFIATPIIGTVSYFTNKRMDEQSENAETIRTGIVKSHQKSELYKEKYQEYTGSSVPVTPLSDSVKQKITNALKEAVYKYLVKTFIIESIPYVGLWPTQIKKVYDMYKKEKTAYKKYRPLVKEYGERKTEEMNIRSMAEQAVMESDEG